MKMMPDKRVACLSDHSKSHNMRVQLIDEAEQLDRNRERTARIEFGGES